MQEITIRLTGIIHSAYTNGTDAPIQRIFQRSVKTFAQRKSKYTGGLKDPGGSSYTINLSYFHKFQTKQTEGRLF